MSPEAMNRAIPSLRSAHCGTHSEPAGSKDRIWSLGVLLPTNMRIIYQYKHMRIGQYLWDHQFMIVYARMIFDRVVGSFDPFRSLRLLHLDTFGVRVFHQNLVGTSKKSGELSSWASMAAWQISLWLERQKSDLRFVPQFHRMFFLDHPVGSDQNWGTRTTSRMRAAPSIPKLCLSKMPGYVGHLRMASAMTAMS
jgi:hypothetical protein